ncbi:hypothetical protein JW992_08370 [candidate division KSB1 bacterium]|nr:hypothetical protein [candidate division KSB1 bacterium]
MASTKRPPAVVVLLALLAFQGLSGIFGGVGLVLDPTGESLQIPQIWLEGTPFADYTIPGWILLIVLGLLPLFVFYRLLKRRPFCWWSTGLVGVALVIWIGVEILMIGYQPQPPLQLIYGTVGLAILILLFLPSVKGYCLNTIAQAETARS